MARRVLRSRFAWLVGAIALAGLVLGVYSRVSAGPSMGTEPAVLLAMAVFAVAMVVTYELIDPAWRQWRILIAAVTLVCLIYQTLWALTALAVDVAPEAGMTRVVAGLAGVGHIAPLVSLSVLPIVATRYIGHGRTLRLTSAVGALAAANAGWMILFAPPPPPAEPVPLVSWSLALPIGLTVNSIFLLTTLLGPVVAVFSSRSADTEAKRRLTVVAVAALAGPNLIALCGVLGLLADKSGSSNAAPTVLFIGMYLAVFAVAVGTSLALRSSLTVDNQLLARLAAGFAAGVATFMALWIAIGLAGDGPIGPIIAASLAVVIMLVFRPLERWVTRSILRPVVTEQPSQALQSTKIAALTDRESEVLGLLAEGLSNAGIAAQLVLSERTVENHLRAVFIKLDLPESRLVNRRVHAANAWQQAATQARGRGEKRPQSPVTKAS